MIPEPLRKSSLNDIVTELYQPNLIYTDEIVQDAESLGFITEIVDSFPNGLVTIGDEGIITFANSTMQNMFGYTKTELIGQDISHLFAAPFDLKNFLFPATNKAGVELLCKKSWAEEFPTRIYTRSILNDGGKPKSNLFVFVDISHEKEMESSLLNRLNFEELLSELSATFVNIPVNEIDNQITEGIKKISLFMGASRALVLQMTEGPEMIASTHSWAKEGMEVIPLSRTTECWPWICEKVYRYGEKIHFISNPEELPKYLMQDKQSMYQYGVRSVLLVPLCVGGTLLGTLAFSTTDPEERIWSEERSNQFKLCGEIFANAILRKRREEMLEQAFSEIKQLKEDMQSERDYLRKEIRVDHSFENIIGNSPAIRHVLQLVNQVASTDATVIILGETGTGKELIARAIHDASTRKDKPLIKVDCATLSSNLIESELFGHEKGAYSGAHCRHIGRFEIANGGTLFLDEIGELPLGLQAKLLRLIQEGAFERLGSTKTIRVNVRIIAATNRDLKEEVKSGRFREDLWYRLNVFPINMPTLRDRGKDIHLLVNNYTKKAAKKLGKQITRILPETMKALEQYSWPGNIRELINVIERAVINTQGDTLEIPDFLRTVRKESFGQKTLDSVETEHIIETFQETNWRVSGPKGAAVILGLHPNTLRGKMLKLGIHPPWLDKK